MDELYVLARRALLDAFDALGPHLDATILVGAQAIYLHTGEAEIAVAEYTTDADLALDPSLLGEIPPLEQALRQAGFVSMGGGGVGIWKITQHDSRGADVDVQVDLLVPTSVSPGSGRRAARLSGHEHTAARKVDGLEGVLVDQMQMDIISLEPMVDLRCVTAKVAGPGALLVSKLFKINERRGTPRSNDKDALDVLRILQGVETRVLAASIRKIIADNRSTEVGKKGLALFDELFGDRGSDGVVMAVRATQPLMDADEVSLTCEVLADDLRKELVQ